MGLEVRPAHDPVREYGFLVFVVDTTNLEGSIWTWWREGGKFHVEKTATIPPEPASKDQLPPLLQGFGAVPPLVTDIDLSMDDKFLYVACWGTGEMRQYDVTDPRKPKLAGSVHIGGIARRTTHPSGKMYAGGPQMVEISRDGKRVYWTNSLYSTWDNQFYPDGVPGAEVMANANANGGLELAKDYWVSFPDGYRAHQIPGSRVAIARRIRLLSIGFEFARSGLGTCRALAGCRRERPLSRAEPGNGMAARGFSRADGKEFTRALVAALWPLTVGHLLAMLVVILPFALLVANGNKSKSAPVSWSSVSASSCWSTGAIRGRWRGYDRRNWDFGRSPWRLRMARD